MGHRMSLQDIERWSEDRKTSREIVDAIRSLACDAAEMQRIWEDPTKKELIDVWEIVTKNGLLSADDTHWGAATNGSWAPLAN